MLKKMLSDLAMRGLVGLRLAKAPEVCPVCNGKAKSIGTVDFNRSCEDGEGRIFEPSGKLIEYCLCERCGYCFAPEFLNWPEGRFLREIYNADYVLVDPEFSELRPDRTALDIESIFGGAKGFIKHLDYGSGPGFLSQRLNANSWESVSFDPFFTECEQSKAEQFDLVTAIEVFSHVPNPRQMLESLIAKLRPDGLLYFSTQLTDGAKHGASLLDWGYLAPRNGHVSLFSSSSLAILFGFYEFKLLDVRPGVHLAYRRLPQWCYGLDAFAALKK